LGLPRTAGRLSLRDPTADMRPFANNLANAVGAWRLCWELLQTCLALRLQITRATQPGGPD